MNSYHLPETKRKHSFLIHYTSSTFKFLSNLLFHFVFISIKYLNKSKSSEEFSRTKSSEIKFNAKHSLYQKNTFQHFCSFVRKIEPIKWHGTSQWQLFCLIVSFLKSSIEIIEKWPGQNHLFPFLNLIVASNFIVLVRYQIDIPYGILMVFANVIFSKWIFYPTMFLYLPN